MLYAVLAIITGLILLVWSADRFVEGAGAAAHHFGVSKLLIGIFIIGFGTSAPELVVSVTSALEGSQGIALGNAYGSNIANIALILGITAVISPIVVAPSILRKELPFLLIITVISLFLLLDTQVSRLDSIIMLALFALLIFWSIQQSLKNKTIPQLDDINIESIALSKAALFTFTGLVILIASSQLLVWGAVRIAEFFGVSDLVIGLTIVAVGTSLPELASSIVAARKGQHDLALGNILGSNMFNTLAVVGLAGVIAPMSVGKEIISRDIPAMLFLTLSLFVLGYHYRSSTGRIQRWAGILLLLLYVSYTLWILVYPK